MKIRALRISLLGACLLLAACDEAKTQASTPAAAAAVEVGVVTLAPQAVAVTSEMPGRTSAYLVSEVRPQVGGIVKTRLFDEGSDVHQGDVLYEIDPATYQASYDSAKAALAKARATVTSVKLKAQRYKELVGINAVSKQDYDDAAASLAEAEADVAADVAALESAKINLDYTKVTAPISGRIGKSSVTPGALVTASQSDALATVQQLDPIYVDVTQPSIDYLKLKRALASGKLTRVGTDQAKVKLVLEDGTAYPLEGALQFSDVTVDQTTGSITLRAIFPNPQHELLPGMFVRAVLESGVDDQAILAPQPAVSRNAKGEPIAYVVAADNKVEQRVLKTEQTYQDSWIVSDGLKAGDRLIVSGLQRIRPGMTVQPVDPTAAAPAAASQQQ